MDSHASHGCVKRLGKLHQGLIEDTLAHVKAEFPLDVAGKDGATKRKHLQSVVEQAGIVPEELNTPPCPPYGAYLIGIFLEIGSGRQNGMSLNPIAWHEMLAWCQLTQTRLEPWEIDAIRRIDSVYLDVFGKAQA